VDTIDLSLVGWRCDSVFGKIGPVLLVIGRLCNGHFKGLQSWPRYRDWARARRLASVKVVSAENIGDVPGKVMMTLSVITIVLVVST